MNDLDNSFLRHMPELMEQGKGFDEALKEAYERDEAMLAQMVSVAESRTKRYGKMAGYQELQQEMSARLHKRFDEEN